MKELSQSLVLVEGNSSIYLAHVSPSNSQSVLVRHLLKDTSGETTLFIVIIECNARDKQSVGASYEEARCDYDTSSVRH